MLLSSRRSQPLTAIALILFQVLCPVSGFLQTGQTVFSAWNLQSHLIRNVLNQRLGTTQTWRRNNCCSRQQLSMTSSSEATSSITTMAAADTKVKSKSLHPKIGDIVRYYDLDGGKLDGQVLIGRITYIFASQGRYFVEVTELEDVNDGYYGEYSSSKRMSKKTERLLEEVSPIAASYVQSEQAFKIPMEKDKHGSRMVPKVRQQTYDLDDYEGPVAAVVNTDILQQDEIKYQQLKFKLLKNSALFGVAGAFVVNFTKGTEDAAIFLAGVIGSLLYLLLLSLKTDTMASKSSPGDSSRRQQLGSPFANLRFITPVLVLASVALYNRSRGELNPLAGSDSIFDTVTQEQFAVAVLGFLTYRIPLFVGQVQDAFAEYENGDDGSLLPGSAGVALKALQSERSTVSSSMPEKDGNLPTILLVSGPQATGRSDLVKALLDQDDRLVTPPWLERSDDGAAFERLEKREEFLEMDTSGSRGLTKDAILQIATASKEVGKVVVIDANVDLAKKLQSLAGTRLIGVWVGLQSVSDFEDRIEADIASGRISIPDSESKESVVRAKIKEIINEIEFGLGSGIFEFTILNQDAKQSLRELQEAASYAFK